MPQEDINFVIDQFCEASRRVKEAGLDLIHLHGAHGYLLCQFLSPYANRRSDKYGGSRENRARFGLELLAAVRKVVGDDFAIGYRLSAEEYYDGGLTIEDTKDFCKRLVDHGIDLIDVSGGMYETFQMIIQGPEAPKGPFVRNAKMIKQAVGDSVPVSVAQRLNDPTFANRVLEEDGLDYISLTRAFHADPHYVNKLYEDKADEISPCIACHHCTNLLELNVPAECAANPHTTHERTYVPINIAKSRKVMVIGGGPAGMHAARILKQQGQDVELYEKDSELGGQMRYSSRVADDYGYLITYLARQMEVLDIPVHLNTAVTADLVQTQSPDVIITATGAVGGLPWCEIDEAMPTFNLFSAMDRPDDDWEEKVVIIGEDSESCFLSLYIAGRGSEVYVVGPKAAEQFSDDKESPGKDLLMKALDDLPTIELMPETTVESVGADHVVIQKDGKHEKLEGIGCVIVGGRTANNKLYEKLCESFPELEVYNIGDSVEPHDVHHATKQALNIAQQIGWKSGLVR